MEENFTGNRNSGTQPQESKKRKKESGEPSQSSKSQRGIFRVEVRSRVLN